MNRQDLIARVRADVRRLRRSYYPNSGDAFMHYVLRTYFELDEDDAYEFTDIGGRNDKGIDAFWWDEEERRVVIVQGKYHERGQAEADRDVVINLTNSLAWLQRIGSGHSARVNDQVRAAGQHLAELRQIDPEYPVQLFCFAFGRFTPAAQDEAQLFNADAPEGTSVTLVDLADLKTAVEEQDSRRADTVADTIELTLLEHFEFAPSDDQPRTVVGTVNGAELAAIEREYQYRIFQQNVRYYLKAGQKVNKSIADTVRTELGRERFWYYNNGIAIVCDEYDFEVPDDQDEPWTIRMRNMQIVNGCQTTTTLGANLASLDDTDSPAYVLVRIVESDSEELQRNITLYNNRQNAVRDRDLMSNDRHQDRLQGEFNRLRPPWFYERKRGEWDALATTGRTRARYGRPARRIDNEAAAQAAYAFYFDPAEARARKRFLFLPGNDGGFYDQLFNEDTTAEWLLLPFRVNQYVAARKNEYMSQIRDIDRTRPNIRERRLLKQEWLKFADQMLVGAIGFMIRQRVDEIDHDTLQTLLGDDFDEFVSRAYAYARGDLQLFFAAKAREYHNREEPFTVSNYVKGNWAEVREALEIRWDLREEQDEDVFEGITALEA